MPVSLEISGLAIAKTQNGIYITDVTYLSDNNAILENSKINKENIRLYK